MTPFQQWVTSLYDHLTEKGVVSKQTEFGDLAGVKQGSVSRWLSKTRPMTPDLESVEAANAVAAKYGFPAYFNEGAADPNKKVLEVWYLIPHDLHDQALRVLRTFAAPRSAEPAPQPPPAAPSNRVTPRFKEQPELPTIGGRRAPHVYLQEWLDSRHWEPEQLARRIPEADTADIEALLSGEEPYTQDWLWYISKAFRTSIESLYGPPPKAEAKPVKKAGKRAAKL